MTISIACYIIAAIIFGVRTWKERSWLMAGLTFFTLGHCLVGFTASFGKP